MRERARVYGVDLFPMGWGVGVGVRVRNGVACLERVDSLWRVLFGVVWRLLG